MRAGKRPPVVVVRTCSRLLYLPTEFVGVGLEEKKDLAGRIAITLGTEAGQPEREVEKKASTSGPPGGAGAPRLSAAYGLRLVVTGVPLGSR